MEDETEYSGPLEDYQIVSDSSPELVAAAVALYVKAGWDLYGPLLITVAGGMVYTQALVKVRKFYKAEG